jgi:hypothetical protein
MVPHSRERARLERPIFSQGSLEPSMWYEMIPAVKPEPMVKSVLKPPADLSTIRWFFVGVGADSVTST